MFGLVVCYKAGLKTSDPKHTKNSVFTCMQAAPYDFLQVDEDLSQGQLDSARAQMGMWTSEGCYPLLPYSSIVLEAVPEQQSQKGKPPAAAQSRQAHTTP